MGSTRLARAGSTAIAACAGADVAPPVRARAAALRESFQPVRDRQRRHRSRTVQRQLLRRVFRIPLPVFGEDAGAASGQHRMRQRAGRGQRQCLEPGILVGVDLQHAHRLVGRDDPPARRRRRIVVHATRHMP